MFAHTALMRFATLALAFANALADTSASATTQPGGSLAMQFSQSKTFLGRERTSSEGNDLKDAHLHVQQVSNKEEGIDFDSEVMHDSTGLQLISPQVSDNLEDKQFAAVGEAEDPPETRETNLMVMSHALAEATASKGNPNVNASIHALVLGDANDESTSFAGHVVGPYSDLYGSSLLANETSTTGETSQCIWYPRPESWVGKYKACGSLISQGRKEGPGLGIFKVAKEVGAGSVAIKVRKAGNAAQTELRMLQQFTRQANIVQFLDHERVVVSLLSTSQLSVRVKSDKRPIPRPIKDRVIKSRSYDLLVLEKADSNLAACQSKDVDPHSRLKLFKNVLEGLNAMHSKDIIHRDLKPENILLVGNCESGSAKITDLETACRLGWKRSLSCPVDSTTPEYMAPELARSIVKLGSKASDMWAAGLILHELVFNQLPAPIEDARKAVNTQSFGFLAILEDQAMSWMLSEAIKAMTKDSAAMSLSLSTALSKKKEWKLYQAELPQLLSGLLQPSAKKRLGAVKALAMLDKILSKASEK